MTRTGILELAYLKAGDINLGGATARGNYTQQFANMDILFNFYLWAKIAGINVNSAPKLNVFLNCLGKKIIGAEG